MPTRRLFRSLVLVLVAGGSPYAAIVTHAEARTDPVSGQNGKGGEVLGRGHLWLKVQHANFDSTTRSVWGVDNDVQVGLEGYWGKGGDVYFGMEMGRIGIGVGHDEDGNRIENFSFISWEFNAKKVFGLTRGLSLGLGGGAGAFLASGEEVDPFGRTDLADIGFGYQAFADFNWRVRRFVTGVQMKYQAAYDLLGIDYSNLRLGGHIGLVF